MHICISDRWKITKGRFHWRLMTRYSVRNHNSRFSLPWKHRRIRETQRVGIERYQIATSWPILLEVASRRFNIFGVNRGNGNRLPYLPLSFYRVPFARQLCFPCYTFLQRKDRFFGKNPPTLFTLFARGQLYACTTMMRRICAFKEKSKWTAMCYKISPATGSLFFGWLKSLSGKGDSCAEETFFFRTFRERTMTTRGLHEQITIMRVIYSNVEFGAIHDGISASKWAKLVNSTRERFY